MSNEINEISRNNLSMGKTELYSDISNKMLRVHEFTGNHGLKFIQFYALFNDL